MTQGKSPYYRDARGAWRVRSTGELAVCQHVYSTAGGMKLPCMKPMGHAGPCG